MFEIVIIIKIFSSSFTDFTIFHHSVLASDMLGDTDSIASDIAPLPNPPVYMPYSGTYNTSHGYQPIQYGCTDRHISSGELLT